MVKDIARSGCQPNGAIERLPNLLEIRPLTTQPAQGRFSVGSNKRPHSWAIEAVLAHGRNTVLLA